MPAGDSPQETVLALLVRFILSRRVALWLIGMLLGASALGYIIPRDGTPRYERLAAENPSAAALLARLGLDDIFGSPLFGMLLVLVLIAAMAAMIHQARIVWRRTFRKTVPRTESVFATHRAFEDAVVAVRKRGFISSGVVQEQRRYISQPWGLWGGFLLHVGLVVAIMAGMVVIGTERRAVVDLAVGEILERQGMWLYEEGGRLSAPLVLDDSLLIESVEPSFWPSDEVRQVTSVLRFLDEPVSGPVTVEVNRPVRRSGVTYYQDQTFGYTFLLEVTRDGVLDRLRADIPWPVDRNTPSYENITLGENDQLQLRCYADEDRASMLATPVIAARYASSDDTSEPATLTTGAPVEVGPLAVTLVDTLRWSRIIMVRNHGVGVLFAGFFMIFAGSALIYMTAPREIYIAETSEGSRVTWRAFRFRESVIGEFDALKDELNGSDAT